MIIEAFGYYHDCPEPDYNLGDIWAWKREQFPVIWDVTIYGQEESEDIIYLNGQKYLINEKLEVLIPFVAMEELD